MLLCDNTKRIGTIKKRREDEESSASTKESPRLPKLVWKKDFKKVQEKVSTTEIISQLVKSASRAVSSAISSTSMSASAMDPPSTHSTSSSRETMTRKTEINDSVQEGTPSVQAVHVNNLFSPPDIQTLAKESNEKQQPAVVTTNPTQKRESLILRLAPGTTSVSGPSPLKKLSPKTMVSRLSSRVLVKTIPSGEKRAETSQQVEQLNSTTPAFWYVF